MIDSGLTVNPGLRIPSVGCLYISTSKKLAVVKIHTRNELIRAYWWFPQIYHHTMIIYSLELLISWRTKIVACEEIIEAFTYAVRLVGLMQYTVVRLKLAGELTLSVLNRIVPSSYFCTTTLLTGSELNWETNYLYLLVNELW